MLRICDPTVAINGIVDLGALLMDKAANVELAYGANRMKIGDSRALPPYVFEFQHSVISSVASLALFGPGAKLKNGPPSPEMGPHLPGSVCTWNGQHHRTAPFDRHSPFLLPRFHQSFSDRNHIS